MCQAESGKDSSFRAASPHQSNSMTLASIQSRKHIACETRACEYRSSSHTLTENNTKIRQLFSKYLPHCDKQQARSRAIHKALYNHQTALIGGAESLSLFCSSCRSVSIATQVQNGDPSVSEVWVSHLFCKPSHGVR